MNGHPLSHTRPVSHPSGLRAVVRLLAGAALGLAGGALAGAAAFDSLAVAVFAALGGAGAGMLWLARQDDE